MNPPSSPMPGQLLSSFELSRAIGGPSTQFSPRERLSTLCDFFADDEQLVAVAAEGTSLKNAGLLLAWGLAYREGRMLSIVLPRAVAGPTLIRAPWFVPEPVVYVYPRGEYPRPVALTQQQSIDSFYGLPTRRVPATRLGTTGDWAKPLEDWAEAEGLQRDLRNGKVAWKYHGMNLIMITKARQAVRVVGGVDSTSTTYPDSVTRELTGQAGDAQAIIELEDAVRAAMGHPALVGQYAEHALQAALKPEQFTLTGWRREVPAWRPESTRSGLIDFVGWDEANRIHLVETKIGPDPMLVLQGLDYWLWAAANLRRLLDLAPSDNGTDPVLDFVVQRKKAGDDPVSIYTAAQSEALHRRIDWRFHVIDAASTASQSLPPHTAPDARRAGRRPLAWSQELRQHMRGGTWLDGTPIRGMYSDVAAARLLPEARTVSALLGDKSLLHQHHMSAVSSQRFALNMLAPLSDDAWAKIAELACGKAGALLVGGPFFEYKDSTNMLAEGTGVSPHQTQVDCLAKFRLADGSLHALLIEVKLTEATFGQCSAAASSPWPDICGTAGPFGGSPDECFQLQNKGGVTRRTYDQQMGDPEGSFPPDGGCWFRDGTNQVMRNVALANALINRGDVQGATFALMAPKGHTSIWAQWERHRTSCSHYRAVRLVDLPAETIAGLHTSDEGRLLASHYLLGGAGA